MLCVLRAFSNNCKQLNMVRAEVQIKRTLIEKLSIKVLEHVEVNGYQTHPLQGINPFPVYFIFEDSICWMGEKVVKTSSSWSKTFLRIP